MKLLTLKQLFAAYGVRPHMLKKKDRQVAFEVERYYQAAKRIIAENRPFLDSVIAALLEQHTVTYRNIEEIKSNISFEKKKEGV